MKRGPKKNISETMSEKDYKVFLDESIPVELAAVILNMAGKDISVARYRHKNREMINAAMRQRRAEARKETPAYSKYGFWTKDEIDYILTSGDPDDVQSEQLGRSVFAIQKKRGRELAKRRKKKDERRAKKSSDSVQTEREDV